MSSQAELDQKHDELEREYKEIQLAQAQLAANDAELKRVNLTLQTLKDTAANAGDETNQEALQASYVCSADRMGAMTKGIKLMSSGILLAIQLKERIKTYLEKKKKYDEINGEECETSGVEVG